MSTRSFTDTRPEQYVRIPVRLFFDRRIKDGALRLYGFISRELYFANTKTCKIPNTKIERQLGIGHDTINRHLKNLMEAGAITVDLNKLNYKGRCSTERRIGLVEKRER